MRRDNPGLTWLEMVILLVPDMTLEFCKSLLPDALAYHQRVAFRTQSHLTLTCDNIHASLWTSARMLSKDPEKAQLGARGFADHLVC